MNKLFNSKFLFIMASSLIILITLVVGAFYLFDDSDNIFIKSGYVLNPLSSVSQKYFFDENTSYKENLSSKIVFTDVDKNDVTVLKDSFIHYSDESLSLLQNGAILDLNSINGSNPVTFYNITPDSIIEAKNGEYFVNNADKDIIFKNYIVRISENKYIIVGNLKLKANGNASMIEGKYFEFVYAEKGIVNIENKDIKYELTAEGTKIYVDNNLIIDLGDKKISDKDKDVMSITAITIGGDDNVEIIPKAEESKSSSSTNVTPSTSPAPSSSSQAPSGSSGSGGTKPSTDIEKNTDIIISLKKATIGSTNVDVVFDIENNTEEDDFKLQVVNLNSGRTVDVISSVTTDNEISVNLLSPNTKYLFTVINNKDGNKYFQKTFETSGFGVKLEKTYTTDSAIGFLVTIEEGTDITNAKLSLYKYNEITKKNEIVQASYYDASTDETKYVDKVTNISSLKNNIEGKHEIVYDGLESNTIYTAVLDEFSVASSNFKDIYNITLTSMTLKKTPSFNNITVEKNMGAGEFKLAIGNIIDEDNAIVNYTYLIYEANKREDPVITPISKSNASPITVSIGEGINKLKNDTNYFYKVIIEYFDNEKYIEYVTTDSIAFLMGTEPYVTVIPNEEQISYDQIGATILIKDNSCMLSMPDREACSGTSTTVLDVSKINPVTGEKTSVFTKIIDFIVDEDGMLRYDLMVNKLQAGTTYYVEIRGSYNTSNNNEIIELHHTDESKRNISTKSLASFTADWLDNGSSANHAINIKNKFIANKNTGTLSGEESAKTIKKVVAKLYEGDYVNDLQSQVPIALKTFENTTDFNIKSAFYDDGYDISSSETFELDLDDLRAKNTDNKLSEYYTVAIYAYYDYEGKNEVILSNNVISYKVSPILLMEDIEDPVLQINEISNRMSGKVQPKLFDDGTTVGYMITAAFDRSGLIKNNITPEEISFYVYDINKKRIKFFVKDKDNNLVLTDIITNKLAENNYIEARLYMNYGTDYSTIDNIMTRGNTYYIGYDITVSSAGEKLVYPMAPDKNYPSDYGVYKTVSSIKETPKVRMYISSSTATSITYKYNIDDPDCALYRENGTDLYGFYYTINGSSENKLNLTKTTGEYNKFSGSITIPNLKNGDKYALYYKKNIGKTGDILKDIVNYLEGTDSGVRLFDGYYDALEKNSDNTLLYNFKYQIINNPLLDNKVTIKILASNNILERILSYKLKFTDSKNNILNKELWNLGTCGDGSSEKRCFTIDYTELKNAGMKSIKNTPNVITLTIDAIYDNGLSGYDFVVGNADTADYKYCILQNNSNGDSFGKYVSFSASGAQAALWDESLNTPKGYYTYLLNNNLLLYQSQVNSSIRTNITVGLLGIGYTTKYGVVTPKMVSISTMQSDNKTFSFNSITPKVTVEENALLLDGAIMNIGLSGVDLTDIKNEGTESNPKYYLYVDTWSSLESVLTNNYARPQVKILLDNNNPIGTVTALINGLDENHNYYFNIYAYMYKNNELVYTQLFDAGYIDKYEAKTYSFKSLNTSDLFHSLDVTYSPSNTVYGNRNLNTKINLLAYKNKYPYDFDIVYAFCEVDDTTCGIENNNTNIFNKTVLSANITTSVEDMVDISEYDLEYDKSYYMYIYAITDKYNGNNLVKKKIVLNKYNTVVKLRALTEPTFVVTRNAIMVGNKYAIDFNIIVNDADKTLVDGKYFIKLSDINGNIAGTMQLVDSDGDYVDISNYTDYAFDANVVNKKLRITDLSADSKYFFTVYSDAYLNNYDINIPKTDRTYEVKKSHTVYTSNNYGIAFGRDLLYSATEKSMVVTFLGGSNFDGVSEVLYTIGLWDDAFNASTVSGNYVIGENNKRFELYKNSEDWRFVIDPEGMKNVLGQTYTIALSFKVIIPGTSSYAVLTSADNPSFVGRTQYVEDEKK